MSDNKKRPAVIRTRCFKIETPLIEESLEEIVEKMRSEDDGFDLANIRLNDKQFMLCCSTLSIAAQITGKNMTELAFEEYENVTAMDDWIDIGRVSNNCHTPFCTIN